MTTRLMETTPLKDNTAGHGLDWILAYDEPTGFFKQGAFMEALSDRLRMVDHGQGYVIVCRIALHRLREVTDLIGAGAMETLMAKIASNWRAFEYDGWIIGREAQDRFLMASQVLPQWSDVTQAATRVHEASRRTIQIQGMDVSTDSSVGVSVFPAHGVSTEGLCEQARIALIHAMDDYTDSLCIYDPSFSTQANEDKQIIRELPNAIKEGALGLMYSPVIDLRTGTTTGFSSAMRWEHPDFGVLQPVRLNRLIQQSGLSISIGEYLLGLVSGLVAEIGLVSPHTMRFSVPMFAQQLRQSDGLERLKALDKWASGIELMVSESALTHPDERLFERLQAIKDLDIGLSVDGIGAGVSNFARQQRYPLDRIWLDDKYIKHLTSSASENALVKGLISLLHSLGYTVVAQGVDSPAQQAMLTTLGCDYAQGLVFGESMTHQQVLERVGELQATIHTRTEGSTIEKTVLLVDDEPNVLSALKRLLRRDEYQIFSTTSPREAFDILAQHRIDVIVSDQRMPDMSGTEFLSEVKELYPDTMRLVLSGYTELHSVTDAINRGAIYKFLTKPWDDEQLRANIREAFSRLAVQRENNDLHQELEVVNTELVRLNHILEQRVMEKNERIVRDNAHLQVMQEVVDNVTVAVIGVDLSGDIVVSNKVANRWFGDEAAHNLIGKNIDDLPTSLKDFVTNALMGFELEACSDTFYHHDQPLLVDLRPMGAATESEGLLLTVRELS